MLTLALAKEHGPFGWGICSKYLLRELSAKTDVNVLPPDQKPARLSGKVLHAIASILFTPVHPVSAEYNAGYCFFELNLTQDSVRNAASYNHIFCGSSYNQEILAAKDMFHTSLLIQGVDREIFNPVPPREPDGRFVIFSGGKFEYRKGQDLVLAAFMALMDKYPDMHLVTVWENMWPSSAATMAHTKHISLDLWGETWEQRMASLCKANNVNPDRVTHYPACSQETLSRIMEGTDLGLFPNRCEGGTNLMMMEYMAKQRPVIASYNSGHKDVLEWKNAMLLHRQKQHRLSPYTGDDLTADWWESDLDEIIDRIEFAYHNRDKMDSYGYMAALSMANYTWEKAADHVLKQMLDPQIDAPDYLAQRYVLGDMLNRMGYSGEGAEIGVYVGALSQFIYSRWNGKKLHLIDYWKHIDDYKDITNDPQDVQEKRYEKVKEIFADYDDVNIIRDDSLEAAKRFADGQLDWVHIDANHAYEAVNPDIETWNKKVRIGGLISGHDYMNGHTAYATFGVKRAVDEFVAKHGYKLKLSADERNPLRTWYVVKDH